MPPILLKGTPSSKLINLKLKQLATKFEHEYKIPKISYPKVALINACRDQESNRYIKVKKSVLETIGFSYNEYIFDDYNKIQIKDLITNLNKNKYISGILLQLPIPVKDDTDELLNLIDPRKDIDGITDKNLAKLKINDNTGIKSCAALGILHLLKETSIDFANSKFVLVGNGKLINYPLSLLLKHSYNAKFVEIVDVNTSNGDEIIKNGDVVVSATGVKERIKANIVKSGVIIVDCGSINNKEIEYEKILPLSSYITPIPGGVGPLTISYLMVNIMKAYCLQNNIGFSDEKIDFIAS